MHCSRLRLSPKYYLKSTSPSNPDRIGAASPDAVAIGNTADGLPLYAVAEASAQTIGRQARRIVPMKCGLSLLIQLPRNGLGYRNQPVYLLLYDSGEGFWSGEGGTWNGGVGK